MVFVTLELTENRLRKGTAKESEEWSYEHANDIMYGNLCMYPGQLHDE